MSTSFRFIVDKQAEWGQSIECRPDYALYAASVAQNLFMQRLNPETESEFEAADGAELRPSRSGPPKMSALFSSSALAVNFFDRWRSDSSSLGSALGLGSAVDGLRFEYKCERYPVGPREPNLDLLLTLVNGERAAVEAKFAEPFRRPGADAQLAPKYFQDDVRHWEKAGLARAQGLAHALRARWEYLDAAQLLKHMLGLATDGCARVLLYLWYDTGLDDAAKHRREIDRFGEAVKGDAVAFQATTYQEAFGLLARATGTPADWIGYMSARYFNVAKSA